MKEPCAVESSRIGEPNESPRWVQWLTTLLVVVVAVRALYRSPYAASDLRITPDEVEYAVCAQRLATLGRYDLELDGASVPPHSTPWFSALLAPAYFVAPRELGGGIVVVLVLSIAGVLVLQRIGDRIAGPLAGALAVIAVLATPLYPYCARLIMTDAPAAAIGLCAALLLVAASERELRLRDCVLAGLAVAAGFALRSVYLALVLPFALRLARERGTRLVRWIALLAPTVALLAANALYNQASFGDWRRTGYQYWCAVPYDYPSLLMSTEYVSANLADLATGLGPPSLALGAIGVVLLLVRRVTRARPLLWFTLLAALPITALHSVYFYVDLRFHVFLLTLLAALGGIGVACCVPARLRASRWSAVACLSIAVFAITPRELPAPLRRITADAIHETTSADAVVISGLEPVYLAALAPPGSQRTYIAASREVEFASKVLARERVPRERAAPRNAFDHRAAGLIAAGAREAHARTADEMPEQIEAWVRAGRPVVLERGFIGDPSAEARILGRALRLEQPQARLSRLVLAR